MSNLDSILREIHQRSSSGKYKNLSNDMPKSFYVYGETNYDALEAIVGTFKDYFNSNTVFYDLGSGTGKIPIHIGLKYRVKKSVGIEISPQRCSFIEDIKEEYPDLDYSNISILNESFLESNIEDATVVYFDNTMYTDPIYESKVYSRIPLGCLVLSRKDIFDTGKHINDPKYASSYGKKYVYHHIKENEISQETIDYWIDIRNNFNITS